MNTYEFRKFVEAYYSDRRVKNIQSMNKNDHDNKECLVDHTNINEQQYIMQAFVTCRLILAIFVTSYFFGMMWLLLSEMQYDEFLEKQEKVDKSVSLISSGTINQIGNAGMKLKDFIQHILGYKIALFYDPDS